MKEPVSDEEGDGAAGIFADIGSFGVGAGALGEFFSEAVLEFLEVFVFVEASPAASGLFFHAGGIDGDGEGGAQGGGVDDAGIIVFHGEVPGIVEVDVKAVGGGYGDVGNGGAEGEFGVPVFDGSAGAGERFRGVGGGDFEDGAISGRGFDLVEDEGFGDFFGGEAVRDVLDGGAYFIEGSEVDDRSGCEAGEEADGDCDEEVGSPGLGRRAVGWIRFSLTAAPMVLCGIVVHLVRG